MSFEELYTTIQRYFEIISSGNASNADLKSASKSLAQSFSTPEAIPALFKLISTNQNQHIRQLASVELRKLIKLSESWIALNNETKREIKENVFQLVLNEPSQLVIHSLAYIISAIAKNELINNNWPALFENLNQLVTTHEAKHQQIGLFILVDLFDSVSEHLEPLIPQLMVLFQKTILADNLVTRVTTVQALGKVADFVDENDHTGIKQYQQFIPEMVKVLQACLAVHEDDLSAKIFEVFDELLILETPLLSKHFVDLFNLFLSIATSGEYSENIRVQALSFLLWCIMSNKSKIGKAKLIPNILNAMFVIAAEEEPEDRDEDYPSKLAVQVINSLATTFPPQQVFPASMQHAIKAVQSQAAGDRKAAMLAIAVLVEGCADFMRKNLNDVLHLVTMGLQDGDSSVRKAACMALGALCDDFEDEISSKHATLVPLLFNLINDNDTSVHPEALSTLDVLLESLGSDIVPYIPGLMSNLINLWGSSSRKVQITATNCIGSVAFAAAAEFSPYFNAVIKQLGNLLTLADPADFALRSVATECVGPVATAVGKDVFRPLLADIMTMVVHGLQFESPQLKQCTFVLFGVLGSLFGDEFAPYLQIIVPPILLACQTPEQEFGYTEEADIGQEDETPNFAPAVAQEKESSIDTLGELFQATKAAFMPFVPDSINIGLELLAHYHDSVRITAATSLLKFFNTAYTMDNANEWEPGLPLNIQLHENVMNIGKLVIEGILFMLSDEEERMVVTQVLQALTETLTITGPAAVAQEFTGDGPLSGSHLDTLANQLLMILTSDHACQDIDDSLDDHDDEEVAELDALVISAAADTVGALAGAIGPNFAMYFAKFFPLIAKYYKPSKPVSDRSMAIGALAEAVQGLESGAVSFTPDLMNLFMRGLEDSEDEVKSNAAFGVGVLCTHSKSASASYYPQLLQLLHPLFNESTTNMKDNACGALCRMMLANLEQVPLEHVLPTVLDSLPLTKDYEENRPIFQLLINLLNSGNAYLLAQISRIFGIFAHVMKNDQLDKRSAELLRGFLKNMNMNYSSEFDSIISGISPDHAQIIKGIACE